jgi:DNA mismatch repair protein MSH6
MSTSPRVRIELILPLETFPLSTALDPAVRRELERGQKNVVRPWDVQETLAELHRRKYYPSSSKQTSDVRESIARWPIVLKAAIEGEAELALSSFGAALYYLQRHLIDAELLSMGIVKAYIPPESASATNTVVDEMQQLAVEQSVRDSGVVDMDQATDPLPIHMNHTANQAAENDTPYMSVDGTTLYNLEILCNNVDHKVTGSLWSKINYTKTPHGSRLLRAWLLRPLFRKADIERRQDAVQELLSGGAAVALKEARSLLAKCGDIDQLLSRVHSMSGASGMLGDDEEASRCHPNDRAVLYETATYTKRKVGDFSKVLHGLRHAAQIPELFDGIEIQSDLLRKIVQFTDQGGAFPNIAEHLEFFFSEFDCDKAAKGLFEPTKGIDIQYDRACESIESIISQLNMYKDEMCASCLTPPPLAKREWKYINIKPDSKDKYLIELPASVQVPYEFELKGKRGSGAKQVNKYRSNVVAALVDELETSYDILKERKARGIELIFAKFDSKRMLWAAVGQATAMLDALGSLAQTAAKTGYSRPQILDFPRGQSPTIKVIQGRHPCVEKTFNSAGFVPNDLVMGSASSSDQSSPRVLLLSGPNMGVRTSCQSLLGFESLGRTLSHHMSNPLHFSRMRRARALYCDKHA